MFYLFLGFVLWLAANKKLADWLDLLTSKDDE